MVAIGGIADIVQHWHEMARSPKADIGGSGLLPRNLIPEPHFPGRKSLM
jgi:hypothetical protein